MFTGLELAEVFRRHGDDYRRAHDGHLGRVERRVMSAIELCRTAALGGHVEQCSACGLVRHAYNSCRNTAHPPALDYPRRVRTPDPPSSGIRLPGQTPTTKSP